MSDFSEKGSDFLRALGDDARNNPLSAALIGMGVLSLFTGGRRSVERPGDFVRRTGFDRIPDAAGSAFEAAYLGETSDTVKAQVADFAAEQTARATAVAEDVMGAATEEARRQGLTVEGAKSAVGDVSAKVGRVVDAAGKSISERATSTKSS